MPDAIAQLKSQSIICVFQRLRMTSRSASMRGSVSHRTQVIYKQLIETNFVLTGFDPYFRRLCSRSMRSFSNRPWKSNASMIIPRVSPSLVFFYHSVFNTHDHRKNVIKAALKTPIIPLLAEAGFRFLLSDVAAYQTNKQNANLLTMSARL